MPFPGGWEWLILVLIALLLFGGSRLGGIEKSTGKAVREFKEETSSLRDRPTPPEPAKPMSLAQAGSPTRPSPSEPPSSSGLNPERS